MNTDQAAEDIVDLALATKKPFAVLSCYIFSDLFTSRILDGHLVRSISKTQLLFFLAEIYHYVGYATILHDEVHPSMILKSIQNQTKSNDN